MWRNPLIIVERDFVPVFPSKERITKGRCSRIGVPLIGQAESVIEQFEGSSEKSCFALFTLGGIMSGPLQIVGACRNL